MNTFTVSYNGKIHKSIEDEKLIDSVERIFHMFDKEITHWSYSITDKTAGKVRKYKRGKVLFKNLQNNKNALAHISTPRHFLFFINCSYPSQIAQYPHSLP